MATVSPVVIALLEHDVASTLGDRYRGVVSDQAANVALLDIADADEKLVEDVQQVFHDEFVDTCWPACPRHGAHPLWYRDGAWWCEQDGVQVCRLGELGAT